MLNLEQRIDENRGEIYLIELVRSSSYFIGHDNDHNVKITFSRIH